MLSTPLVFLSLDPAQARLDRLQVTWDSANGATLVIGGSTINVTVTDGLSGIAAALRVGPRRFRMIDVTITSVRRRQMDGTRLWLGGVEYRRLPLGSRHAGR